MTDSPMTDSPGTAMPRPASRFGAWAAIVFSLLALVSFASEASVAAVSGIDPDDAVRTLAYLAVHPLPWIISGLALTVMALALIPAALAGSDALGSGATDGSRLVARSLSALGIIAAALFLFMGVLRQAGGPIVFMSEIDRGAGLAAAAAVQVIGAHGAAQGGILALCLWAVALAVEGLRTRSLPGWLCALAVIPALRVLLLVLGPFGVLPDEAWFIAIAVIPLSLLWPLALGVALLVRRRRLHPLRRNAKGPPPEGDGPVRDSADVR